MPGNNALTKISNDRRRGIWQSTPGAGAERWLDCSLDFPTSKAFIPSIGIGATPTVVEVEWSESMTPMTNFEVETRSSDEATWVTARTTAQRFNVTRYPPNTAFKTRVRGLNSTGWTAFTPEADIATTPALGSLNYSEVSQHSFVVNATLVSGSGNAAIVNFQCSVMSDDVLLESGDLRASKSSDSSTLGVKLTHSLSQTGSSLTPLIRYTVYTPTCWAQVETQTPNSDHDPAPNPKPGPMAD